MNVSVHPLHFAWNQTSFDFSGSTINDMPLNLTGFFPCNVVRSLLDSIALGFYLRNIVPRLLKQHWTKFTPCNAVWRLLDDIAQSFYLSNVDPRELREHWIGFFLVQCCLEPQGQHCLGYLLVQCYPKSIKTTLNSIFSCAMLSGVSRTTLHRAFTCAMLSQEY